MLFHKYQPMLLAGLIYGPGCSTATSNQSATSQAESPRSAEVDQQPVQEKIGRTLYHNPFNEEDTKVWGNESKSPDVFILVCLLVKHTKTGSSGVQVVPAAKGRGFAIKLPDDCLDQPASAYGDSAHQEYYKWAITCLADINNGDSDREANLTEYLHFLNNSFVALAGLDDQVADVFLRQPLAQSKPLMQDYIDQLKKIIFGPVPETESTNQ